MAHSKRNTSDEDVYRPDLNMLKKMADLTCTMLLQQEEPEARYNLLETIGSGTYSTVHRAERKDDTGKVSAVKVMEYHDTQKKGYGTEMIVMINCQHENLIRFIEGYRVPSQIHLAMEYISGVTLNRFSWQAMWRKDSAKGMNIVAAISRECLKGLEYFHAQGYIHRDIKGSNILVSPRGEVKLCDFGAATVPAPHLPPRIGTCRYMAPEVKSMAGQYGQAADIWSLGITILELQLGGVPSDLKIGYQIIIPDAVIENHKKNIPDIVQDFLLECLDLVQGSRPTAKELLQDELMSHACPLQQIGDAVKVIMEKEK